MDREQRESLDRIYDKLDLVSKSLSTKIDEVKEELFDFKIMCEGRFSSAEANFKVHKEDKELHQHYRFGVKSLIACVSIIGILSTLFGVSLCDKVVI